TFQAIKHKAVDMLQALELSRVGTHYAAWTSDAEDPQRQAAAAMCKGFVGEAAVFVTAEDIQIHGGVGFTWDADPHLLYRRSKAAPAAACPSNAIQPVLDRSVPTAAGVRIVGVEVRECRNGYARVMAIVDNSGCGKSGGSCYGNEQVFLRDVNGRWTYLDSG